MVLLNAIRHLSISKLSEKHFIWHLKQQILNDSGLDGKIKKLYVKVIQTFHEPFRTCGQILLTKIMKSIFYVCCRARNIDSFWGYTYLYKVATCIIPWVYLYVKVKHVEFIPSYCFYQFLSFFLTKKLQKYQWGILKSIQC